ncbi:MAG: hypothetical protein KME05_05130 [Gloeocapsa sp. UFS-A4-WI-NPMV-4B04]|jgi:hypothetical protein|nr:hypothetical protein [Gloeocapsa sp. UFS-A4-WI-NPMV-4B04]
MNVEEALIILDTALEQKFLNNVQELVFHQSWLGHTYLEMAENSGYNSNYIKDVGYKLWKLLSEVFEQEVTKSNFRSVLRRQYINFQNALQLQSVSEGESLADEEKNVTDFVDASQVKNTTSVNKVISASLKAENVNRNSQNNINLLKVTPEYINTEEKSTNTTQNWRQVIDIAAYSRRVTEIDKLKQWIMDERCQLVAVFEIESISKTTGLLNSYNPSD